MDIKFRAPHAVDATCFLRNDITLTHWLISTQVRQGRRGRRSIRAKASCSEVARAQFLQDELAIMTQLRSPRVARFYGVVTTDTRSSAS